MEIPNYVMMPVPEQLVPRVMEHILHLMARDAMQRWDEESFFPLFHESSEKAKAVMSLTSRRRLAEKEVTADMVAELLGISVNEVMATVRTVNEACRDQLRPSVITAKTIDDTTPSGRQVRKRLLEMSENMANLVEAAETAEREGRLVPPAPPADGTEAAG